MPRALNPQLRLLNWNVAWATPKSAQFPSLQSRIRDEDPEIVCLTEAQSAIFPNPGFIIDSGSDYGYPIRNPARRKVILWSAQEWIDVDPIGDDDLPIGRYVSGVTSTSMGNVRVIGVCIPWSHAHVNSGRRDREAWEDHLIYLAGLKRILEVLPRDYPTIITGDFNQRIPRKGSPIRAFSLLEETFDGWVIHSKGVFPQIQRQVIDHVASCAQLRSETIEAISRDSIDGTGLSDHDGVVATLTRLD